MRLIFCSLFCVFLINGVYGGMFGIPNPIKIAEGVAGGVAGAVEGGAKTVAGGVVSGVEGTAAVAETVAKTSVKGTKTVVGKVREGVYEVENGVITGLDEVIGTPIDLKEVTFYLATAKNYHNPTKIDFYEPKELGQTKGKVFFIIHGWQSSRNATAVEQLSEILTTKHPDSAVVQVNWDRPATDLYPLAAFNTESVGNFVGILINKLVTEYKIPRENIVIIGHSLGGQIAGWAGKKFKELSGKKLARIVALDPAGPLFVLRPSTRKLNKHDADVVMVIHSDGGKLGYPFECGTIDFWPNGGSSQPGCWSVDLAKLSTYLTPVTCDHSRAWDLFVEALNVTGSFLAKKCDSLSNLDKEKCKDAVVLAMGDIEAVADGSYYLKTGDKSPYSLIHEIVQHVKDDIQEIKDNMHNAQEGSSNHKDNGSGGSPTNVNNNVQNKGPIESSQGHNQQIPASDTKS